MLVTLWHSKDQTQPGDKCEGLDAHQRQQKQKAGSWTGVHWEEFLKAALAGAAPQQAADRRRTRTGISK